MNCRQPFWNTSEQGSERQQLDQQPGRQTAAGPSLKSVRRHPWGPIKRTNYHVRRLSGDPHRVFRWYPGSRLFQAVTHDSHCGDERRRFFESPRRRPPTVRTSTIIAQLHQGAKSSILCRPSAPLRHRFRGPRFRVQDPGKPLRSRLRKLIKLFPNTKPADYHRRPADRRFLLQYPRSLKNDQGDGRVDYPSATRQPVWLFELGERQQDPQLPPFPALSTIAAQRRGENRPQPNAQISYTRVWNATVVTDPRQLHAPGYFARRGQPGRGICTRSLASAGIKSDHRVYRQWRSHELFQSGGIPRSALSWSTHSGIQQRLGLCPKCASTRGLMRSKWARVRQIKVSVLPGPRSSWGHQYSANQTPSRRRRHRHLGRRSEQYGRRHRFGAAGQIDNSTVRRQISFRLKRLPGPLCSGRLEGLEEIDLTSLRYDFGPRSERDSETGELRSPGHDAYIPKGKQQDLPLPPNFAASSPTSK